MAVHIEPAMILNLRERVVALEEGAAGGSVISVNGDSGVVVLDATDVGADATGTAAAAVTAHDADTSVHGIADTATLYRAGGTDVAVADGGTGASTAANARTNLGLGTAATTAATDYATAAQGATADAAVPKALYDANTILAATSDNTPVALTVAASRVVGRKATGDIAAMTGAETGALIKLDELAAPTDVATLNASTTAHGLLPKLDNNAAHFLTGQGTWGTPAGAGDMLKADNLTGLASTSTSRTNLGLGGVGFGCLGVHSLNTAFGTASTHTTFQDEGLTKTVAIVSGRRYKLIAIVNLYAPGGANSVQLQVMQDGVALRLWNIPTEAISTTGAHSITFQHTFLAGASAGAAVIKLQLRAGTANTQVSSHGDATQFRQLIIEDFGSV